MSTGKVVSFKCTFFEISNREIYDKINSFIEIKYHGNVNIRITSFPV